MSKINFKLSDGDKFDMLWSMINADTYNEEGNWTVSYSIVNVYDDYFVCRNVTDGSYERVYYKKCNDTNTIELGERKACCIVDVTEEEAKALDAIRCCNNYTFEGIDANYNAKVEEIASLNEKISENEIKIEEYTNSISTLTMERDNANTQIAELTINLEEANANYSTAKEIIDSLTAEKDALVAFKKNIEDENKKAVIAEYAENLAEEVLDNYRSSIDEFTVQELDMKLAYELKQSHPEFFSKNPAPAVIPKDTEVVSGLEEILSKYERH